MTLVLSVLSRDTFWVVVDRRLSYPKPRPPTDDAIKVMDLQTVDGRGLLAYAGLGATPRGTQPSEWMSAVLRGRAGLTMDQALGILADVATRELPRHLTGIPGGAHSILVPAFLRGVGPRVYSIDNLVNPKTGVHSYRYTYLLAPVPSGPPRSIRVALAGSGGAFLKAKHREWLRDLLRLVKAHDRGMVSPHGVADILAALNNRAHLGVTDKSVGPRCIVAWRRRADARRSAPGGEHHFYTGTMRESDAPQIPTISNGMDVSAIAEVVMNSYRPGTEPGLLGGLGDFDRGVMNQLLGTLPSDPDEPLR